MVTIRRDLSAAGERIHRQHMDKIMAIEILDHDGYDEDGAKSELWDLYILFRNEENTTCWKDWEVICYHRERWYGWGATGKEQEEDEYVLERRTTVKGLESTIQKHIETMFREKINH